jgi:hypothetical protein
MMFQPLHTVTTLLPSTIQHETNNSNLEVPSPSPQHVSTFRKTFLLTKKLDFSTLATRTPLRLRRHVPNPDPSNQTQSHLSLSRALLHLIRDAHLHFLKQLDLALDITLDTKDIVLSIKVRLWLWAC